MLQAFLVAWHITTVARREEEIVEELRVIVEHRETAQANVKRYAAAEIDKAKKAERQAADEAQVARDLFVQRSLERARIAHHAFAKATDVAKSYPTVPNPVPDPTDALAPFLGDPSSPQVVSDEYLERTYRINTEPKKTKEFRKLLSGQTSKAKDPKDGKSRSKSTKKSKNG
jgi:hypothetical protein